MQQTEIKQCEPLTPKEVHITLMGLSGIIDDLETCSKDPSINWTPEARRDMSDILSVAKTAKAKIAQAAGSNGDLPPYNQGDEKQFLTKES